MELGRMRGIHVVILMFAIMLLSVPLASALQSQIPDHVSGRAYIGRFLPHALAALAVICITPLRQAVWLRVSQPLRATHHADIAVGTALAVLHAFAWMGAYVLWFNAVEGPTLLEKRLSLVSHQAALAQAWSPDHLMFILVLAGLLGPIIEELVFRGLLFPLWQEGLGWLAAMMMSSVLFGLYHENFVPAFVGSLIYTCVYLRTGSLKASIFVHAIYNISTWYPLLGQFIAPRDLLAPGDPASWSFHIAALCTLLVALPIYIWISRPAPPEIETQEVAHAALPR